MRTLVLLVLSAILALLLLACGAVLGSAIWRS